MLVDAAAEPERLLPLVADGLATVVTTHQHWDHHRALADVVAATGAEVVVGEPDADADHRADRRRGDPAPGARRHRRASARAPSR